MIKCTVFTPSLQPAVRRTLGIPFVRLWEHHTNDTSLSECTITYSEHNGTERAAYRSTSLQVPAVTNFQKASVPHRSVLQIVLASFLPPSILLTSQMDAYIIKKDLVGYIHTIPPDVNGDDKAGLEEAVYALMKAAGL